MIPASRMTSHASLSFANLALMPGDAATPVWACEDTRVVDFPSPPFDNRDVNYAQPFISGPGISILPLSLAIAVGVFFGLSAIMGIFVVIVVANRAEPDPSGRRPTAVYLFGVSFFSLFAALFGSFAVVLALVQLIGGHPEVSGGSQHPVGDAVARVVVLGGLIFLVAVALLTVHLRRGLALPGWNDPRADPVTRVGRSYIASVSFVSVLIAAGALVAFVYEIFRILGPGVFELSGSRVVAARVLIATAYLALAAGAIVVTHQRMLPPGSRWSKSGGGPENPRASAPVPTAAPAPAPAAAPAPAPAAAQPPPAV